MYQYGYIPPAATSSKPLERYDSCSPPRSLSHVDGASNSAPHSQDVMLQIRQQPKEALLATDGKEKGRKPVDPPPIIQLKIGPSADPAQHFLQSPYLFMCCALYTEDGKPHDESGGKTLTGSLVSSLHRLKDINNSDGGFFVFGDISVKIQGMHRLQFSLFDYRKETNEVVFLQSVMSDPFKVLLPKDFRGLDESTYLSRAFSDQGVRLRLRKEPRAVMGAGQKRSFPFAMAAPQAAYPPPPPYIPTHPDAAYSRLSSHQSAGYLPHRSAQASAPPHHSIGNEAYQYSDHDVSPETPAKRPRSVTTSSGISGHHDPAYSQTQHSPSHLQPSLQSQMHQHMHSQGGAVQPPQQNSQTAQAHHQHSSSLEPYPYSDHDPATNLSPDRRPRTAGSDTTEHEGSRPLMYPHRTAAPSYAPSFSQPGFPMHPSAAPGQPPMGGHNLHYASQNLRQHPFYHSDWSLG